MRYLVLALVFTAALLLGASRYATEGQTYVPISYVNAAGTTQVPLEHCDLSILMITSGAFAEAYNLQASAPSGTVCNIATTSDQQVIITSTGALFFEADGTTASIVTCDTEAEIALGCFASFLKLTADRWTHLGTPHGHWIWP